MLPKAWQNLMVSSGMVPFVVNAIERVLDDKWSMDPNTHDYFELVYMKRGEVVFEIEEHRARLVPNSIVIIKPGRQHKLLIKSPDGCEFIVFSFRLQDSAGSGVSRESIEDFIDFAEGSREGPYISLKVGQRNEIIDLLNRIVDEKKEKSAESEFLIRLMVLETFVYLSRALRVEWENSMKGRSLKLKQLIRISENYIRANYESELSLSDIAGFIYLSPSYFARVFRDEMKQSPISYLLKVRIEKSMEMLEQTTAQIGDIALAVGFSNHQRFIEIFRKHAGMTPSDYRRSKTQGNIR